ncbi:host-nuclease inhibitor Gam family protein [uncultured Dysosmobacter sp.]|uniref:host-nuclease inhibitor Gam family protein n=1 Tax=uncultured Dysosmobacter sp. TaxID=2591384 RepID=UPI00262C6530|nr:host-nuclease inhibitor Gam family protein [uncultured Dysosmobacter sp.]
MARKRVEDNVPALESWDDVNQALATIGDNMRTVEGFEADMQEKIDAAKAEAEAKSRVYIEGIKRLEVQIKEYAEAHRDDMEGRKTKALNFGSVGFRKSTKITLPKAGAKLAAIIEKLRSKGMDDCIRCPSPTVDKEALRKYPAADIVDAGAGIKVDDVFWYEPDREKLERG